ncbi:hypothetical protein JTB14_034798 [Gonioctena quinquepunctata]|nr:hypothetical protein JTB14_034798 [Gonioctena quinquepunctata]
MGNDNDGSAAYLTFASITSFLIDGNLIHSSALSTMRPRVVSTILETVFRLCTSQFLADTALEARICLVPYKHCLFLYWQKRTSPGIHILANEVVC